MKGMVAGEPIKTGALTKEFEEGHERTFGTPDPSFPRGRKFVWDPVAKKLVQRGFVEEKKALDAPILSGRFYENTKSPIDGADIGSRRRHQVYMRDRGLAPADDFKGVWADKQKERAQIAEGRLPDKTRRDDVGRALHKLYPE